MILGLDIGASAVKAAGYRDGQVLFTHSENGRPRSLEAMLESVLEEKGFGPHEVEVIAVTGVGAEGQSLSLGEARLVYIPEFEATGEGGTWLAGVSGAVVVSLGTGTSLVMAKDGAYTHVGGSGVGSGTVRGLAKRLSNITDTREYFALAEGGNSGKVDLRIRDLFSGTDTLPLDLTASNLAKPGEDATDADWAAGIINMALEVAGSHGALACAGFGLDTVIITGGLSATKIARTCYEQFDRLYPQKYIIPPHSGCATAIGAARRAERGA